MAGYRPLVRTLCATMISLAGVEQVNAGEVWSWHALDVTVLNTRMAEVTLHGRLRTGRSFGTVQQGRGGVITKFGCSPARHV